MSERLLREIVGEELGGSASRGETLREVAKRADVSTPYLSEIERGRKEPSSEVLAATRRSLDASLLDLTRGVTERLAP
jgi:transcriptional regulator with XRE-family HTH domain